MSSIVLTIAEIKDLCMLAGADSESLEGWGDDEDSLEEGICIHYHPDGILVGNEDTGTQGRYWRVATFDGCDPNEVYPLGDPL